MTLNLKLEALIPDLAQRLKVYAAICLILCAVAFGLCVRSWLCAERADTARDTLFVSINTADRPTLQLLPGVGPATVEKILDTRRQRPFTDEQDLQRTPGIGPKLSARMAPYVDFSLPPASSP